MHPTEPVATITEPGVYDLTDAEYHADPIAGGSLSSTGGRRLLAPSCPAKFRWLADHPEEYEPVLNLGSAAHKLVLGAGRDLVVIDADNYRTNAARDARADAHALGLIPLLSHEHDQVVAMADALRAHPIAGRLYTAGAGRPEQTLVWRDRRTGIWRRARVDWLPDDVSGARMLLADYKTCASAEPDALEKAIHAHGYHMQGDWHLDGVYELGLARHAAFLLVCQEKTPPYVVTVMQLHPDTLLAGQVLNDHAIDVYRRCVATGRWPGYSDKVVIGRIPAWAEIQFERAHARGDYAPASTEMDVAA
jgi:hypothetical protein